VALLKEQQELEAAEAVSRVLPLPHLISHWQRNAANPQRIQAPSLRHSQILRTRAPIRPIILQQLWGCTPEESTVMEYELRLIFSPGSRDAKARRCHNAG
jgi:hypothetical protein